VVNPRGEILVVSQRGSSWSLPKGHIENGEDALFAACREIEEESGIPQSRLTLVRKLGKYERFRIGKPPEIEDRATKKELTFFLFTTDAYMLKPKDSNNPEARWVKKEEVAFLLTHPKDKAFFEKHLKELEEL